MDRMPSEEEVLLRMMQGDESAFTKIYRHYHASLYVYLLRFCKVPSLAEDLVHDVFLKVWEIRDRINPELSFTGYLYRIARNHVIKTIDKLTTDKNFRDQLFSQLEDVSAVQPEQQVRTKEYDRLFQEALVRMPPQRLNVFKLCRQEGKSYDEVALLLGISRNAVKKHMVLGMRFIYDYVHRHGDILLAIYLAGKIF
ncbi:RNA polymerase sigma factor [Chitinophaga pinensis]|uniref:RNA polymerase, sigma-24 subunit, ECF subfamily n=1 Tax=Chitinophaga pinensis (strain ATCC 43595 / DSM 2588 / LMG 13176 / NBRC 15968 / NCIMB 11800 / UQM 2034) TaxID=485918 RepID=A0A979GWL6_CHIPD|nr:RNA polymerase sigma-70 factor [Chitinophaga pinensis]ACU64143.1 RNA polymerase, sigma-24 subunit, ECF subfamily [Chitinophaga pinensis DSM 2588]